MKKLEIYMNNNGGEFVVMEEATISILSWGSPIGLGIFLVGLGYLIKASETLMLNMQRAKHSNYSYS
jgi:hypothetical protein